MELGNGVSRRGFMKGALLGAGAMALSSRMAMAEQMLTGKTAADIQGAGVEKGLVRINMNENPLGASPRAIEAVAQHLSEVNRYSYGTDLPVKLHKAHGIDFGMSDFDMEDRSAWRRMREMNRILLTAGSSPILQLLGVLGCANGTGECIEVIPGYGQVGRVFESFKEAGYDTNLVLVPTTADFVHDLAAIKAAITPKTTLVVITNPNNPTGTIVPHAALEEFVDSIPKHIMILIDEAYIHFVREPDYKDAVDLALTRENVVVTRTFSKIYGLAGLRIGYGIANKPMLDKMMLHTGYSGGLTILSMHAAGAAIEDHAFAQRTKQVVDDGKDYLYAEFDKMGLKYIKSHGNFMIVDVGRDSRRLYMALRKKDVMIRSGWSYATEENNPLKNHIRISIGTPDELEVFMSEFKTAMSTPG